ncbi:response regulator [Paenibacillus sp. GD4]|jgi:two-component system, cell cycle response regulator|uniref:response regulator n=1 Tax=Paenibacillus sp. GD4 TaxID=3068890 RepID=UPI002796431F|nr:response regulator [Paenibacillus sp. GD4]MDQ1910174.1 response regulator [Paenibacillus sp. GD4]
MTYQQALKRPVVCILNDKAHKITFPPDFDCQVVTIISDESRELLDRIDLMNPDCTVMLIDPQEPGVSLTDWVELRQYCEVRHIPVVVIVHENDQETITEVMADAAFYLPLQIDKLLPHIQRLLKRRQRILDQILIDPLTGAFNYRYLRAEVDKQLTDMKRSHETFSMVYMELDAVGTIDYEGHRVLRQKLVEFIQKSIRPTDCVAHYSNHGFILVLPKTAKEDAMKLMNRLTKKFAEQPIQITSGIHFATFSCKIVEFVDADKSSEDCLKVMPFTDSTLVRSSLVMDGTLAGKDTSARKLKLAIIDDDRLIREMLRHQLSDIGDRIFDVEIKVFADGEEFFNDPWHRQNERFLLIVDRILPKMDGLEILSRIRAGYDRRRYLILMLSSKGKEADITLAIQRGANDYMTKPFSLNELRARITRLIGGFR